MDRISHWVGGKSVAGESGRTGPVFNPATGAQTHEVEFASAGEVDAAVATAQEAFAGWRRTSLSKRADILFRIREAVHEHRKDIARLITEQHGKVLSDAMGEVARGLENIEFATGIPHLLKGGFTEQASTGVDVFSIRQPLGVVAGITPFNFPAMVPMWMFANAIACGNAFILKPSEKDPGASLYIAELLKEAGLPDGVFNVVNGDKVVVDRLLEHPGVEAVSFVGSTPIAKYIYATGTANGKRVQALGGAKNHMVVLPDADLDMAADAAVSAAYGSAGERCMAISVVVAVGDVADPLVDAIEARLPLVKIGDGLDPESEMGPLVTREHRDRVAGYIASAAEQGATIVEDGREHGLYRDADGFFLGVSLIDHVTHGDGLLPRRDLRAGAHGRAREHLRRGPRARERQPLRQRHSDLHARRRGGAGVPVRLPGRHGGRERSHPGAGRATTRSAGGRTPCSATATCTVRRASGSTRAARWSPSAGRTRARPGRPRVPEDPMMSCARRSHDARGRGLGGVLPDGRRGAGGAARGAGASPTAGR